MEDVIKEKLCNFCVNNNKNNCMKIISSKDNDILTYKCENFICKGDVQMDKEEVEKFSKEYCKNCKEPCCNGLCDNGTEIVCIDRNIHLKKNHKDIKKD